MDPSCEDGVFGMDCRLHCMLDIRMKPFKRWLYSVSVQSLVTRGTGIKQRYL